MEERFEQALAVLKHAIKKAKRGKQPSMWYRGIRNPKEALYQAISDLHEIAMTAMALEAFDIMFTLAILDSEMD